MYHDLSLFLSLLNRLIRATGGMCHITDNIVAAVDHPVVAMYDGIARVGVLYPLRDDGIGCVGVARLRHIGEDAEDFDVVITFAELYQNRVRHAVKAALRADIERFDTMITNQALYLLMQLPFDTARTIPMPEECTRCHLLHLALPILR